MTVLWHYTCDHGHQRIGRRGVLLTAYELVTEERQRLIPWAGQFVWLTDLQNPNLEALGLTSILITCDRSIHRYRADDDTDAIPWMDLRKMLPAGWYADLEEAEGALPRHWWVAKSPVHVTYTPL